MESASRFRREEGSDGAVTAASGLAAGSFRAVAGDGVPCGSAGVTGSEDREEGLSCTEADEALPNSCKISSSVNSGIADSTGTELFTCSGLRCFIKLILSA